MRDVNELLEEREITDYESITLFKCSFENLTSLDGIEKLINLKKLYCYNNQLTSIDLSKNIKLQELDCINNQLNIQELYQQINNNKSIKYINTYIREYYLNNLKHKILEDFRKKHTT